MVVADQRRDPRERLERRQDALAELGVRLVQGALVGIEAGRSPEDLDGEADLAEIVVGEDTRLAVSDRIGRPSSSGLMQGGDWFYVGSTWKHVALRAPQEIDRQVVARLLEFSRVQMVWGSDDMGFRSQPLISPADMRELVLPGHKALARMVHDAGRLYILHSCGNLATIMDDLIDDVQIDAKHSYEDTIVDVREAKVLWGDRIALLGGIDMDFLCRANEETIRARLRSSSRPPERETRGPSPSALTPSSRRTFIPMPGRCLPMCRCA